MRATTVMALAVLMALGLSACGTNNEPAASGPDKQHYCAAVKQLAGKHRPAPRALAARVENAGNAASGVIAGDWHDISVAVSAYADAASRSLLDPARPPYGLDAAKTRALNRRLLATAYQVNVGPVRTQIANVRREVRSDCGLGSTL